MGKLRLKLIFFLLTITLVTLIGSSYISIKKFIVNKEQELVEMVTLHNVNMTSYMNQIKGKDIDLTSLPIHFWTSGPIKAGLYGLGGVLLYGEKVFENKDQINRLIQKVADSKTITTTSLEYMGNEYYISTAPVDLEKSLFALSFSQKENASLLLKSTIQSSWGWILAVLFVVSLLALWMSISITAPLELLTKVSMAIGDGKYDEIKIVQKSKDEIGILSSAFLKMISKIKDREKEIIKKNRELALSEKLATLGQFSAGIAHEIKNPLGSIRGNSQLIERELKKEQANPEKCKELAFYIKQEVDRASDIIGDILAFSRQDNMKMEISNLNSHLSQFIQIQRAQFENKGIEIIPGVLDREASVLVDVKKLDQVIGNLMNNAADAMESVQKKEIRLETEIINNNFVINITDKGVGMSENQVHKIFDPFFTTKSEKKGTGLGLSICHGIIKGHGGEIKVQSTLGEGTTFSIFLPLSE